MLVLRCAAHKVSGVFEIVRVSGEMDDLFQTPKICLDDIIKYDVSKC